jgi:integrase/recombinase XerC
MATALAAARRRCSTLPILAANRDGREFGEYGVCYVRFGKAQKGSPPQRRSVLTVWEWTAEILDQWFTEVRPAISVDGNPAAWPSERGIRVG